MRKNNLPMGVVLAGMMLVAESTLAQQSVYAPQPDRDWNLSAAESPLAAGEPRELPPAHDVEARPIPRSVESRFPVRLATAEEPQVLDGSRSPLRLSPRSESPSSKLDRPATPTPSGAIGTVAGSLGIVLGLFLVLAWCSRRFAPAGSAQLPKEVVELLGRSSLGSRQHVQLVRIGNKLLLVAQTTAGVETLTEITDPVEVERLAALCRRGQPASASRSFTQVLGQLTREPAASGFAGPSRPRTRGTT